MGFVIKIISWHQMTRVLSGPAPNGILNGYPVVK
jgi:hypothetical protein